MLELPRLPHDREWSFEETLDKMVAAGFHGVQTQPHNKKLLDARKLRFATSARVNTCDETAPTSRQRRSREPIARRCTSHGGWRATAEVDALVDSVDEASARHDLPAYIETHRATAAQDLWRLQQLIHQRPEVRSTATFHTSIAAAK